MKETPQQMGWLDTALRFCLHNKLVVLLGCLLLIGWGVLVAPFDWSLGGLPRDPVAVDAIPDLGENQQIVFTRWPGRSPRDIEDQITYPLTTALLGLPSLKSVRSYSYFGFSTVYLIFKEGVNFYDARSRILEKLNSLPSNTLPKGARPSLGPDATALGQIFWYTLEGRDKKGKVAPGWDRYELRKLQDWYVRYALQSAPGVAEVASIGGFVSEYQIDVQPDKLRFYGLSLQQLYQAIRQANQEIGARTIEINRVEYVIRARGYLKKLSDIESIVIKAQKGTPITVKDVATVRLGPAPRRGALDKDGAEVVGGVVVARYGANPLEVIKQVKAKIKELSHGLPSRRLKDGRISKVTIVPFYDRTDLIKETLATLEEAITLELLVTLLVVLAMLMQLRSALVIAGTLPIAVLLCFIAMKYGGVDANIVALSGIAIAIGTMVDMGIVLSENIIQHLHKQTDEESTTDVIFRATSEVAPAVVTAVLTTVISFLPVFTMQASEGKLFRPLAYTKTFALLAALFISLFVLPILAQLLLPKRRSRVPGALLGVSLLVLERLLSVFGIWADWGQTLHILLLLAACVSLLHAALVFFLGAWIQRLLTHLLNATALVSALYLLSVRWLPLGAEHGMIKNILFVAFLVGGLLGIFVLFRWCYASLLRFFLRHKVLFLSAPLLLLLCGGSIWLGFERVFSWVPALTSSVGWSTKSVKATTGWKTMKKTFPGLKKEFMPSLNEGSFLFMPTTMPHASIGEALRVLKTLDKSIRSIPEVSMAVGKIGRAGSALDPAPISMIETIIHYKPKYRRDKNGKQIRQWRPHIRSVRDIWQEIVKATKLPGTTSAPFLQPIEARLVMLQSGMRAPMGIKIKGPDLQTIEKVALQLEALLKKVPQIAPATVLADRVVGKPYLEFDIDRKAIARYGLRLAQVQQEIQMAIGGKTVTTTIEGRERTSVVVRYPRELRTDLHALKKIMVATPKGIHIPLFQLASLRYVRGPQMLKSEDTFLIAYVVFDKKNAYGAGEAVEAARKYLLQKQQSGEFVLPAGVSYRFSGTYENQIRAEKRLALVLPLALFLIGLILYLQFRSLWTTSFIFAGVLVAWAGGFLMLWCYAQPWFLDMNVSGVSLREIFHVRAFDLSVAIWVGFIALFGIATDDGVVMATYLDQSFEEAQPDSIEEIRTQVVEAGQRRVRPCLMTTATTLLALLPILTSSGRGADIMLPMALPSFGGMAIELLTLFVVPVLYCWRKEAHWKHTQSPPWWRRFLDALTTAPSTQQDTTR
ncbi:MAG TPA: hypothetical protein DCE42_03685 [Myxococcales bacterium]|nr:hypothetical protein [Deltaproteobacteria bacterium]HAA53826.1 hypothetical protein [Myxococcales bacterium]|tara:strand:+ start:940 stop:4746 length:3807 start_codon:yes stop_codon:yes gene_type:complete